MKKVVNAVYFSATDTTRNIVLELARKLSQKIDRDTNYKAFDFTLPQDRKEEVSFTKEDIVIVGVPVYAGRVPNVLLKYLNSIKGNGALAIAIVLYGNRNYDDSLVELVDILDLNGFKAVAAGAFIGEHSFSKTLAQGRPDEKDMVRVNDFANQIYEKILNNENADTVSVKGNRPYGRYYQPRNPKGEPVDIRKVKPKTNNNCIDCKLCADVCPMGSIDREDVSVIKGICIKCCACVKKCPASAKYYDDEDYLRHKYELEVQFAARKEPELFI